MERITGRNLNGEAIIPYRYTLGEAVDQLCDIEDILGPTYDLSRLKELVEADRDGRCVVLPCKVGDTVFVKMQSGKIAEAEVRDYDYFYSCKFCLVLHRQILTRNLSRSQKLEKLYSSPAKQPRRLWRRRHEKNRRKSTRVYDSYF